jgi:hypothetical protein
MWGTGRPREVSNWVTRPGMMPKPSTPPFSSLPSKSSCMPRHMPRKGRPACKQHYQHTLPVEVCFCLQLSPHMVYMGVVCLHATRQPFLSSQALALFACLYFSLFEPRQALDRDHGGQWMRGRWKPQCILSGAQQSPSWRGLPWPAQRLPLQGR